ncbi:MAG: AAA family ATPase [Planctomycetes bacterium]|nr:AAA family ATPase [Planctomycetota bacterium]
MAISIGSDIIDMISIAYQAKQPVLLVGGTGLGKSEILQQAAAAFDIGYIMRDLSLMEPADLVGIPTIASGRTSFAPPDFLPTTGHGLLVLEELNRAQPYMLAPTLELLTARRLNDYVLPPGWLPVAAINPARDGYTGTRQLDAALEARFMRIEVKPDKTQWLTWAGRHDVHPLVIGFIQWMPDVFEASESNPRAWTAVSSVLKELESAKAGKEMQMNCISGLVGDKMATAFLAFLAQGGMLLPETTVLLDGYPDYRGLIKKISAKNDTAQLNKLVKSVMLTIANPNEQRSPAQRRRWGKHMPLLAKDLPAEFRGMLTEAIREFNDGD